MQTSAYVNSENCHLLAKLFNIGILLQIFKMSAVCRNTSMESAETLTLLLDSVVDDALVLALPLLSDALPQLIQSPDILSVDAFLEHAPHMIVYWI